MARDCFQRNGPAGGQGFGGPPGAGGAPKSQFDSEYANLMAELGEGGAVGSSGPAIGMITNGAAADGTPAAPKVAPWRIPENWFSNSESTMSSP
jgi:splicing factor 1